MSDHDDLSQRLHSLASDAAQCTSLPGAPELRKRANRRRTVTVAVVSLATASVIVGGWAVATAENGPQSLQPAGPTSPTSAGAPSSTTPTTGEASTTATAGGPTPTAPTGGPWVTTIPADVKLPHQGVAGDADSSDWAPDPSQRSWRLLPCLEQKGYPSDAAQTDRRSILQSGPEFASAEQLALYPDAVAAAIAIEEMQASLTGCAEQLGEPDRYGDTYNRYWGTRPAELPSQSGSPDDDLRSPDDAFHAWSWFRMRNSQGQETGRLGGEFFTVARAGNAIYLTMAGGESDYSNSSDVDRMAAAQAREAARFMPTLCRFAGPGGC